MRGAQAQPCRVDDHWIRDLGRLGDHPRERQVRQLVLRVAAADVGVHAGEPDLLDPPRGPVGLELLPELRQERRAILVERQRVARVLDVRMQGRVVKRVTPRDEPADPGQPQRPHGVPHADEVRRRDMARVARTILRAPLGALAPLLVARAIGLVDPAQCPPRQSATRTAVDARIAAAAGACRDTAECEHAAETAHGVGAAAEAEEIDPVTGLVHLDQGVVAVDDVPGNPEPGGLADHVVDLAPAPPVGPVGWRAEPRIVERLLNAGNDGARAVELVDVARKDTGNATRLPGSVREDQNVLGHAGHLD